MMYASFLSNRGLVKLSGPDREPFLQGLVTNDVSKISETKGLYTWLLTPQGKYLYDLIIIQVGGEWWIEVDLDRAQDFVDRLTSYILRSKVSLSIDDQYTIVALWGQELQGQLVSNALELLEEAGANDSTFPWTVIVDPRLPTLGARLILDHDAASRLANCSDLEIVDENEYHYHRLLSGIPESASELCVDKSIPLECGMDELNAIDWNKGCYVGQELTARTRYRGLVRKRLMPMVLMGPVNREDLIYADGKEVGKWYAINRDQGLALLRLEALESTLISNDILVIPHMPSWMKLPEIDVPA